jgi:hypothetical protein
LRQPQNWTPFDTLDERCERHAALLHGILENNVDKWQKEFLDALRSENRGAEEIRAAMQTPTLDRSGTGRSQIISGAALPGRA